MKFSSSAILLLSLSTTAQSQLGQVDSGFGVEPPGGGGGVDPGFGVDPPDVQMPDFEPPEFDPPEIEKPDFEPPEIEKPEVDLDPDFGVDVPEPDFDPDFNVDPPGFEVNPDFGVDVPDGSNIDPDFAVDVPDGGNIDPDFGVDVPDKGDIDPGFSVDPIIDPGSIDPGFGVDPPADKPVIDPGFGVDPPTDRPVIDPGFGVDPPVVIDPDFGVDPPTNAPEIDPDFGVDPLTETPTPEPTDATDSPTQEPTDATTRIIAGKGDANGCIPSAGESWCASLQTCIRSWETPCDTILLGEEGGSGLLEGWTLFEPFANAKLETESGDCTPTNGEYIQANLDYMQGVNVECDDDSVSPCQPLIPTIDPNDKWLVTNFVLATPTRECPNSGSPLTDSLGVQFYAKDDNGSRSISSKPTFFGRLDDKRGTVATIGDDGTYYYASCVKVPVNCRDDVSDFAGWTGISYQNRPLGSDDCNGPIDLYIDSIVVSSECPLKVKDDKDLDADKFCKEDQIFQTDLGVCDTSSPTATPSATADADSTKDGSDPTTPSDTTASAPPSDAPNSEGDADDLAALEPNPFPTVGSSAGAGISVILTKSMTMVAVTGILVAAAW